MTRSDPVRGAPGGTQTSADAEQALAALRELTLAAEEFRSAVATRWSVGVRETEAMSYLRARGPMNHRQLGAAMRLTPGSVTALVDRMETHGLARRVTDPTNRRVVGIELVEEPDTEADPRRVLLMCLGSVEGAASPQFVRVMEELAGALRAHLPIAE